MGLIQKIFGSKNQRELKKLQPLVDQIATLEPSMKKKSDSELTWATPDRAAEILLDQAAFFEKWKKYLVPT